MHTWESFRRSNGQTEALKAMLLDSYISWAFEEATWLRDHPEPVKVKWSTPWRYMWEILGLFRLRFASSMGTVPVWFRLLVNAQFLHCFEMD